MTQELDTAYFAQKRKEYDEREAAAKAKAKERRNAFAVHGHTTETTYQVELGGHRYRVKRQHEPTRPASEFEANVQNEWKVYGWRNGWNWLDDDGPTAKKVIARLKAELEKTA